MLTQSLVSVIFEAEEPIEKPVAVTINQETGKLKPCLATEKFIGIAMPGMEPDVTTLRTKPTTGPVVVIHKGIAKVTVMSGTYKKGTPLRVVPRHPRGYLDVAANEGDTVVAYAAEDAVVEDGDVITVFII